MMNSNEQWDYVIVGAGAAGCVLANRLSTSGRHRVLVLEAGGSDSRLWIKVPAGFTRTLFDRSIGWGYVNAPGPGVANRAIPCPRGRVIGGSSSINGHLYVRGQAQDYADWVALGAQGWGWEDVIEYFRRSETRLGGDPRVRGQEGPLQVNDPRLKHSLCETYLETMDALGHGRNGDYNSGDQEGCGYYQYLMKNGRRWSAADAYLRPALSRPNLLLRQGAQATRIMFEGRRAVGVEYRQGDSTQVARAGAEVLVAAGSINSPHLLQLSGVGDPAHLAAAGIPVQHVAARVGENLVDHYAVRIAARVRGSGSLNERTRGPLLAWEVLKYVAARRGLLSSAVAHAFGFLRSTPGLDRPDLQILFAPASYEQGKVGQATMERLPGVTCGLSQLRPLSRGHVRALSKDPFAPPLIQPNYLSHEEDVRVFLTGIQFARRLFKTRPLVDHIEAETWPGTALNSDDELIGFIRGTGSTMYHPVGSCRMGVGADSPLDPQLRVKGLDGLRVIDASAMPSMVSGNTYATTMMIGEKGAQCVLDDSR